MLTFLLLSYDKGRFIFTCQTGLLATLKNNLYRVDPLRHVEPILYEEERRTRKTRVPFSFVSVIRKTRTHVNRALL